MSTFKVLITCEHASNDIPGQYRHLFTDPIRLESHEGWDPGALGIAKLLGEKLGLETCTYDFTRLLIEVNRSVGHPKLFSDFTDHLSESEKESLLNTYYFPYRDGIERKIKEMIADGHVVVHLSVHTFTPNFFGVEREVEVGLLFDESKLLESRFCKKWQVSLDQKLPKMKIRLNEPYKGSDDGFTTYLRTKFIWSDYLGIELEVSQKFQEESMLNFFPCLVDSFIQSLASLKDT